MPYRQDQIARTLALAGAQRHPQPDFASVAGCTRVDEDPVEPDAGQAERQQTEDAREGHADRAWNRLPSMTCCPVLMPLDQHLRADRGDLALTERHQLRRIATVARTYSVIAGR